MCRGAESQRKNGVSVEGLLEQIVDSVPPPEDFSSESLQALIIDSWFDNYLGVVSLIKVVSQDFKRDKFQICSTGKSTRPIVSEYLLSARG